MIKFILRLLAINFMFFTLGYTQVATALTKDSNLEIDGALMIDYSQFDGLHNHATESSAFYVRKAEISGKYRWNEIFSTKLKLGWGEEDNSFNIQTATLIASLSPSLKLSLGKMKEPMGLEANTSSPDLVITERSMPTEAFMKRRNVGINMDYLNEFSWGGYGVSAGIFDNSKTDDLSLPAFSGRYNLYISNEAKTWPKWFPKKSVVHFGISGSNRHEDPDTSIRLNESIEVYQGDSIVESGRIHADKSEVLGAELAFSIGPAHLISEYMTQSVTAAPSSGDLNAQYSGGYIQMGVFLTGQSLKYDKNHFEGVSPKKSKGAWLLSARFSELDARDNQQGSEAESINVALTYFHNKHLKLMLNYSEASLSGRNAIFSDEGKAMTIRAQYTF